jgi:hypothetical protein
LYLAVHLKLISGLEEGMEKILPTVYRVLVILGLFALCLLHQYPLVVIAIGGVVYFLSFLHVCVYNALWKGRVDLLSSFFAVTLVYGGLFYLYSGFFSVGVTSVVLGALVVLLTIVSVICMMGRGGIERWWRGRGSLSEEEVERIRKAAEDSVGGVVDPGAGLDEAGELRDADPIPPEDVNPYDASSVAEARRRLHRR